MRARAAEFAREWRDAHYERGEAQSFYNDFFNVFGMKRRQVATFEEPVKRLGDRRGFLDLFWKGTLLAEHKSAGKNLARAKEQALDYFPYLKAEELPRYILVCDFQNFELTDLDERTETKFRLADFPANVEAFNFVRGLEKRAFKDQDPVNIKASELVGGLHDALEASGYEGHDLERFLVRIVFCLFADDTGIFEPRDILFDFLSNRTNEDGSDTGPLLIQLFDVLNTPVHERQKNLDDDLKQFPYIDGALFEERLRPPYFDGKMRSLLLEVCEFNWSPISPAIFGALFQSVMKPAERRRKGAHYTTELNILKLIRPLFLDALRAEFADIKARRGSDRKNKLTAFHNKLAGLTFFDPACGCGNFLIITYRELRRLEIEVLKEIHPPGMLGRQTELDVAALSKLDVDRFYGIEIEEFPARIAETALWMMDHIMNNELSLAFGQSYARIPLKKTATIRCADALQMDWTVFLPPERCSYVLGNPPFGGFVLRDEERARAMKLLVSLGATGTRLDYVSAWFLKAGQYVQKGVAKIGFVATNSITQGEQVPQLWPALFNRYRLELFFAHRTFAWGSDARGKAHVHVTIVGLIKREFAPLQKRLFSYDDLNGDPVESVHDALSPYLFDASALRDRHLVVKRAAKSLMEYPQIRVGTKPVDGGHLIVDTAERDSLVEQHADLSSFLHPFIGGEEFLNGGDRWLLCLQSAKPEQIRRWPEVLKKLAAVRHYREREAGNLARSLANAPVQFHVTVVPKTPFLAIPEVSSERREYVPIGWLEPPIVPSNQILVIEHASLEMFGVLTSRMHMAWLRNIGGRLKSDYRYSSGIVYNPFPWPNLESGTQQRIRSLVGAVLDARARFPDATLADLYDPDAMPPELRKAHRDLDTAVDNLYRRGGFSSDRERVEHLFALYERLIAPLAAVSSSKRRSQSATSRPRRARA